MSLSACPELSYRGGELYMEDVSLTAIAQALGTPAYVYSSAHITRAVNAIHSAFAGSDASLHYAVKANSNLSILRLCHHLGCGFDIVSGGELSRVMSAGGDPSRVIFSGVGKSIAEIDLALKLGIGCFNVESEPELARIAERARLLSLTAPISIRVNPDVDANTHPYISTGLKNNKFGVPAEQALQMYRRAAADDALQIKGIDCHIGSQISDIEPLFEALQRMLELVDELGREGIALEHIDLGGGMGVTYRDEAPLDIEAYGAGVRQMMAGRSQQIQLEPGRAIVANAGVLLTRTEYLKPALDEGAPNFAVVDAAMNDLLRPALYQAWHDVVPVVPQMHSQTRAWDIVGPVCESGDFLARDRQLAIGAGDLLAVTGAGAYGMTLASNYNSRGRSCEVLVDGDQFALIRRRETIEDQLRLEQALS